jgi:hypothetical protein
MTVVLELAVGRRADAERRDVHAERALSTLPTHSQIAPAPRSGAGRALQVPPHAEGASDRPARAGPYGLQHQW